MNELPPLPDDVSALLRQAAVHAPSPPPGVEAAVLAKVTGTVAVGAGAMLAVLKPVVGVVVATTLGAGIWWGATRRAPDHATVTTTAMAHADEPAPHVAAPPGTSSIDVVAPAVDVEPARVEAVAPVRASAAEPEAAPVIAPSEASAPRTDRAAEAELLEAARAALRLGDGAQAMRRLREHQRRFGATAQLREERDALAVVAWAQSGDAEQARRSADAFLRRYPHSIFRDMVNASLAP